MHKCRVKSLLTFHQHSHYGNPYFLLGILHYCSWSSCCLHPCPLRSVIQSAAKCTPFKRWAQSQLYSAQSIPLASCITQNKILVLVSLRLLNNLSTHPPLQRVALTLVSLTNTLPYRLFCGPTPPHQRGCPFRLLPKIAPLVIFLPCINFSMALLIKHMLCNYFVLSLLHTLPTRR
jgi:hypothetical protein